MNLKSQSFLVNRTSKENKTITLSSHLPASSVSPVPLPSLQKRHQQQHFQPPKNQVKNMSYVSLFTHSVLRHCRLRRPFNLIQIFPFSSTINGPSSSDAKRGWDLCVSVMEDMVKA